MYVCITIYNKILEDHGNIENVNHITQSHSHTGCGECSTYVKKLLLSLTLTSVV